MNGFSGVKLKVREAEQRDVGKKIARIDQNIMRALGLVIGDFIEIEGPKSIAAATVWPLYSAEAGRDIIRIDSYIRRAIGASIGDYVTVKPVNPAEKVVLAPLVPVELGKDIREYLEAIEGLLHVKEFLMSKILRPGEVLFLPLPDGKTKIPFVVLSTQPNGQVYVTGDTEVVLRMRPASREELEVVRGGVKIVWDDSVSNVKGTVELQRHGYSIEIVRDHIGERVKGLKVGYGCVENGSWNMRLSSVVAPNDFEGEWDCCKLGCGGWGCAYKCSRVSRTVVFKVPRGFEGVIEGSGYPTVSERLMAKVLEKARVLGSIRHPDILRLLGVSRSAPLLVYEYGDSGSVEWQLNNGWTPSPRDAVLVGLQVGDALRYIHSRGLVHGDVKPGNTFLVGGVAKLGDFSSMVRLVTQTSSHSRMGYTPGFRAPEQAYSDLRFRSAELGLESRMDVYMLGNLLLYMLTGESIDGEEAVKPGVVEEAVAGIGDEALRGLVARMLEPKPWDRPSIEEVVRELVKIFRGL